MRTSENRPSPLPWTAVEIDGGFWGDRQRINRDHTMPAVYHQCKITGRIDAWNPQRDPNLPEPHIFWDSDVAKWIEAVGYSVALHPNAEFERQVDEIVDWMEQMQLADGYANSHFIAVEPENRWRNLRDQHELYCAGHLIEAAIVYAQVTGKRKILDILRRYADHIAVTFGRGDGQKRGYPGHPELELALMRLYQATDDPRYRDLAQYFVDERGQAPHYYDLEAIERGEDPRAFWARSYHYCQAHAPIREQTGMVGHSVRACYLYTGTTDLALEMGDAELTAVAQRLWDDLTGRHMYVTGGVGSIHTIEGFTVPFDLPNDTAYSETCSAIALCYWSQRMFSLDPHRRYIDAIERALYNCILSGVAYDGETFFQCNPLEAYPHISPYALLDSMSAPTHHRRVDWFDVSCCPPNLVRMVASVGGYFYATTPNRLYVHLYNQNTARLTVGANEVHITQATDYPWDGGINFTLELAKPTRFDLALRIPGWCREYAITVNCAAFTVELDKGYAVLNREWRAGDQVTLMLAMPIERIAAHPRVRADVGCVALQRGPLVYCLEEADNGAGLAHLRLPRTNALNYAFDADLFGGVGTITGEALRGESAQWCGELYAPAANLDFTQTSIPLRAIPYCFWANRQPGEMRVWIRET